MKPCPDDPARRLNALYELNLAASSDPMDLFLKATEIIGEMMGVKAVCLSAIAGGELHFLSVYADGKAQASTGRCLLAATPCATVQQSQAIQIYENVAAQFPAADFLKHHRAFAYCGVPSLDCHGEVVAVTCLLDDRPREFSAEEQDLLRLFGQRIGLEMERRQWQQDRRAMADLLDYSEQRFRDLAESTGELVWETDAQERITYLSDLSAHLFGHPPAFFMGKNFFNLLCREETGPDFIQFKQSLKASDYAACFEYKFRLDSSEPIWLRVKSVRIRDKNGQTLGYRGTASDITDSKRIEDNLLLERNRLRRILDSLSVFVALLDRNGHVIEANRAPWVAAGVSQSDYLGIPLGDSPAWSGDTAVQDNVRLALQHAQAGQTIRYEAAILTASGIVTIDFSLVPLLNEHGQVDQIVAYGVDISTRKNALEALRRSEERLELAIYGADLGLWDWDVQTGVVEFSESWASMLGYTLNEIQPKYEAWEQLVHPEDLPNMKRAVNDNLGAKTPLFEIEYRILSKSHGWKWMLARGKVVKHDTDGRSMRVTGIDMDISGRKNLEERLRQRQEELYYAQRLTAAGELTAIVAHELNQPLGAISNYVGGAILRYHELLSANPTLAHVLEETLKLSQRAMAVIQGIRGLVRKQEGKMEWVSLQAVVDEVLIPFRNELSNKQIRLMLDIPAALPPFWCEKIHLQQLLLNLILNAIQAMDAPECPIRKLMLGAKLNSSRQLEIRVGDSGPGIAENIAGRLFEPFLSTKADGIGLGLSICRTIAEAYGGRIDAQSMARQGTVFEVVLPLATREADHG